MQTTVDTEIIDTREACAHCFGTGRAMTVSDLLQKSLELLGTDPAVHDEAVARFYGKLFAGRRGAALAPLFPKDLLRPDSDGAGKAQRDKLLAALLAVGQTYIPDNPRAMEVLDTHLATYGRSHAAFHRPDGTVSGATVLEYAAVWDALIGVLETLPGWDARFTAAWEQAYDYSVKKMIAAQEAAAPSAPFGRFPRQ